MVFKAPVAAECAAWEGAFVSSTTRLLLSVDEVYVPRAFVPAAVISHSTAHGSGCGDEKTTKAEDKDEASETVVEVADSEVVGPGMVRAKFGRGVAHHQTSRLVKLVEAAVSSHSIPLMDTSST